VLLVERIALLREAFAATRLARPFVLDAIVVLPDHLHCLWTLPPGDDDFASRWARIKAGFSRRVPCDEHRRASRLRKRERGLWQRRYWEHWIRGEEDLRRHLDYIHFNPVKHGHAQRALDWPYSSFRRCVARGLYPRDWAGDA
jgi:putative transposase